MTKLLIQFPSCWKYSENNKNQDVNRLRYLIVVLVTFPSRKVQMYPTIDFQDFPFEICVLNIGDLLTIGLEGGLGW